MLRRSQGPGATAPSGRTDRLPRLKRASRYRRGFHAAQLCNPRFRPAAARSCAASECRGRSRTYSTAHFGDRRSPIIRVLDLATRAAPLEDATTPFVMLQGAAIHAAPGADKQSFRTAAMSHRCGDRAGRDRRPEKGRNETLGLGRCEAGLLAAGPSIVAPPIARRSEPGRTTNTRMCKRRPKAAR